MLVDDIKKMHSKLLAKHNCPIYRTMSFDDKKGSDFIVFEVPEGKPELKVSKCLISDSIGSGGYVARSGSEAAGYLLIHHNSPIHELDSMSIFYKKDRIYIKCEAESEDSIVKLAGMFVADGCKMSIVHVERYETPKKISRMYTGNYSSVSFIVPIDSVVKHAIPTKWVDSVLDGNKLAITTIANNELEKYKTEIDLMMASVLLVDEVFSMIVYHKYGDSLDFMAELTYCPELKGFGLIHE